jgi:hypothetical protein
MKNSKGTFCDRCEINFREQKLKKVKNLLYSLQGWKFRNQGDYLGGRIRGICRKTEFEVKYTVARIAARTAGILLSLTGYT